MLKFYNTLTRKKESFKPIKKDKVGMYVCGPTCYSYQHIGNLRTYIFADILRRVLNFNGYNIKEVPIHHYPRVSGESSYFNIMDIYKTFKEIAPLWRDLLLKRIFSSKRL